MLQFFADYCAGVLIAGIIAILFIGFAILLGQFADFFKSLPNLFASSPAERRKIDEYVRKYGRD